MQNSFSILVKSNCPNSFKSGKNNPRSKIDSVTSIDRGTLYERALRKREVMKLKIESAKEKEEREIAACSFAPDLHKSVLSYQGSRTSPDRRSFAELYTHLMKPVMKKAKLVEYKNMQDTELINNLKKQHEQEKK